MIGFYRSKPVRLGRGYSIEFQLGGGRMDAIWDPALPPPHVGRKLLPAYRQARGRFLTLVAEKTGSRILCVDAGASHGEAR